LVLYRERIMVAITPATMARLPAVGISLVRLLFILPAIVCVTAAAREAQEAQEASLEETSSLNLTAAVAAAPATPSDPSATSVISIFYIDERAYEGLPYTLFHRDSGAVIGVDAQATTFVITTTRTDQRPSPTHSRTDNITTGIPTLKATRPTGNFSNGPWWGGVGGPSTITQGPSTFLFTGTRNGFGGPNHTVINQCRLNGTVSAACNLTHVGAVWYTGNAEWNGTYSTYSYNWTSGDRFGFAPVTITLGVDLMAPPAAETTASQNAAAAVRVGFGGRGGSGGGGRALGWGFGSLELGMGGVLPVTVLVVAVLL
jgi:hypothetical protein